MIAEGTTFTPYAAVTPCSARCHFCSENLEQAGFNPKWKAVRIRALDSYQVSLEGVVRQLANIPLGLSLSGLEISDSPQWLAETVETLLIKDRVGVPWGERAAYTNGAGFAVACQYDLLVKALSKLNLDRLELSRHHFDEVTNQSIMRFRAGQSIQEQTCFESIVGKLAQDFPLALVCLVQQGGVNTKEAVQRYLHWARHIGVDKVIFRALSEVPRTYQTSNTYNYVARNHIPLAPLMDAWKQDRLVRKVGEKHGYYYNNIEFEYADIRVIFESSSYEQMVQHHNSQVINKLVFYGNGNLCADWHPSRQVIYTAHG